MSMNYDAMIIAPHPDDAEFGMGGTMIKLTQAGKKVISVCLTQGEMGTYGIPETRREEFEHASKVSGCDCVMLDFPDTGIENDRESRVRVARLLREYRPQVVFAPYYKNDLGLPGGLVHVDHYTTGALVRDAVKFSRLKNVIADMEPH
ncbi:MAG: PIG-L family deacetylase, partial [Bdellovibrionales bacterium]|nr:PIG-L family deacetylase [Bdellovibrionales bacterium]